MSSVYFLNEINHLGEFRFTVIKPPHRKFDWQFRLMFLEWYNRAQRSRPTIKLLRTAGRIVSNAHDKILVLTPFGNLLKSRTSEKLSGITVFLEPTLRNHRIELALPILLRTIPLPSYRKGVGIYPYRNPYILEFHSTILFLFYQAMLFSIILV